MRYIFLTLLIVVSCTPKKGDNTSLGKLDHDFSISESSSADFDKGLLLLHSFEYDDAGEAFAKARKKDPDEVMAYWGEAMSYYKALWGLQEIEKGRAVLKELGATHEERVEKAENELEIDFLKGVEILFGDGEEAYRQKEFSKHMSSLYDKYPGNQEVAAFYSLSLMWASGDGRDEALFDLSSHVAAGILEENPSHPGALHYMIHANDDPAYAALARDAADLYADVAPDAAHALHMPSHIYLALGMWEEVVASNIDSYQASVARMEKKGLDDKARGYHSYAWLHYGHLQLGQFEEAERLLSDMYQFTNSADTRSARSYLVDMQTAQRVEYGKWPENLKIARVRDADLGIITQMKQLFFRTLIAFDQQDMPKAEALIDTAKIRINTAEIIASPDKGVSLCGMANYSRYTPSQSDIDKSRVMLQQMMAMHALLDRDTAQADALFQDAVRRESATEYSYGPPDIPYPSFEQYGYFLLEQGHGDKAASFFEQSLARAANRRMAVEGKAKALESGVSNREDKSIAQSSPF